MQNVWMNNYQTTLTAELPSGETSLTGKLADTVVETMLVNAAGAYQVWLTIVSADETQREVVIWDGTTLTRQADRIGTDWNYTLGAQTFAAGSKVYCDMPQAVLSNLEAAVAAIPQFAWQSEVIPTNGQASLPVQGAYRLNLGGLYLPDTNMLGTLDWCLLDASGGTEAYTFFDDQNGPPIGLINADGSPWTWTFTAGNPGVVIHAVPLMRYGPARLLVVTQAVTLPDTVLYL